MTELQTHRRKAIAAIANKLGCHQISYSSAWLGYFPFGIYQWIECNGEDIARELPSGWKSRIWMLWNKKDF